jgi:phospholysine phosphohistidine inorganic pyrophosphate phosphatase
VGRLTGIDTVLLLDLDGTLYVGSQVVPGASETVRWLRAQGLTVRFTTNTDSIPPTALADRLAGPGERATHVLVADPSYGATYDDLNAAFRALRSEAQLITTQVNRIARRDDGEHLDTGGWVRLLEYATGQSALVVGDDLAADIGGGHAVGAATVLVRSGKGDRPQPGAGAEPDAVVDSVADLPGLLQGRVHPTRTAVGSRGRDADGHRQHDQELHPRR